MTSCDRFSIPIMVTLFSASLGACPRCGLAAEGRKEEGTIESSGFLRTIRHRLILLDRSVDSLVEPIKTRHRQERRSLAPATASSAKAHLNQMQEIAGEFETGGLKRAELVGSGKVLTITRENYRDELKKPREELAWARRNSIPSHVDARQKRELAFYVPATEYVDKARRLVNRTRIARRRADDDPDLLKEEMLACLREFESIDRQLADALATARAHHDAYCLALHGGVMAVAVTLCEMGSAASRRSRRGVQAFEDPRRAELASLGDELKRSIGKEITYKDEYYYISKDTARSTYSTEPKAVEERFKVLAPLMEQLSDKERSRLLLARGASWARATDSRRPTARRRRWQMLT